MARFGPKSKCIDYSWYVTHIILSHLWVISRGLLWVKQLDSTLNGQMSNLTLCGSKRIKSDISISDEQIWFRFSSWSKMTIQGPWSLRSSHSQSRLGLTKYDENDWAIENRSKMWFLIGYWSLLTKNTKPNAELSDNRIFEKSKKFKKGFYPICKTLNARFGFYLIYLYL